MRLWRRCVFGALTIACTDLKPFNLRLATTWADHALQVDREVESVGSARYKAALVKLLDLERLSTADAHAQQGAASKQDLLRHRDELKSVLNRQFGSAFRSLNGHTWFAHQLLRNADIYMGKCESIRVVTDHFLRPLRRSMPHEPYV